MAPNLIHDSTEEFGRHVATTVKHDGQAGAGTAAMFASHFLTHMPEILINEEERERCHYCQLRKFSTYQNHPIIITNQVDGDCLPETFRFIDRVVPSANVPKIPEDFIVGCSCNQRVIDVCITSECLCLSDIDAKIPGIKKNAYHGTGKLRSAYLKGVFPIYECGPNCECTKQCPNRVVQRGRTVALEIFKTKDGRGWGVKTKEPIMEGYFVDCYYGELLTAEEAQARRDEAESAQQKDVYLFALDKFTDELSPDPYLHDAFEIDGEFLSGPTRFINHSCDPNLRIFAVVKHPADRPFHALAFFAVKDIPEDTELTFDYLDGVAQNNKGDRKKKRKCLCGSKNCRGYIF